MQGTTTAVPTFLSRRKLDPINGLVFLSLSSLRQEGDRDDTENGYECIRHMKGRRGVKRTSD